MTPPKTYRIGVVDHLIPPDQRNQITRVYTASNLFKFLDKINSRESGLPGEFGRVREMGTDVDRAATIDLHRVSHCISNVRVLEYDGSIVADISFYDTPLGQTAEQLLNEPGSTLGFGLRALCSPADLTPCQMGVGVGNVDIREVVILATFDIVENPSVPADVNVPHNCRRFDPASIIQVD